MQKYNPKKIEARWQKKWYSSGFFKGNDNSKKPKFYVLDEFPYPSGDGLHVGHLRPYIGMDVIARKRRMQGFNVLFPMGWDAFGLPTENYAIKHSVQPAVATAKNTKSFKRQMNMLGLSFDWSREINTTDPKYYKWTQWIFIKLFEKGLAYKDKININWCPSCKIGLANEEVVNGKCERCGSAAQKKEKEQWLIKITEYAERLIDDLNLVDYPARVKSQQKDWIGKSQGALVKFPIEGVEDPIEVFTTRIDTIFSGTFLILSPGHKYLDKHRNKIENWEEVESYSLSSQKVADIDRVRLDREVTGVEVRGIVAHNPATNEAIPVWVADFVLDQYGTGAVFADAHDARDFALAKKYGIPLRTSIAPKNQEMVHKVKNLEECYEGEGILYNSMQFDDLESAEARPKIILWLKSKGLADNKINYKLRDWVFSRQHYWGEPIPMINCQKCDWVTVPEKELPVELPKVKKYQPTDDGESPLSAIEKWVKVKCPKCGGPAKRETDTMPNWAGSNWYFMRYTDPKNSKALAGEASLKYWMPVDWYNGGMEHTTLHLLYSRFIFKFLHDIGAVPKEVGNEPYKKRTSHGVVLAEGGVKMSKSKGNVINPDDVVKQYGADTLRVYEMFMGPFEQAIPWDTKGIVGARRFLEKVYKLVNRTKRTSDSPNKIEIFRIEIDQSIHRIVKKVSEDIELMKFNTAASYLMSLVNALSNIYPEAITREHIKYLLLILSPFAPHLTEELWDIAGFKGSCNQQNWPKYDENLVKEKKVSVSMQVNGRPRDRMEFNTGVKESVVRDWALNSKKVKVFIGDKEIKKIIFVKDKLINIVI
jgi:leucyl-tRNA synthetase